MFHYEEADSYLLLLHILWMMTVWIEQQHFINKTNAYKEYISSAFSWLNQTLYFKLYSISVTRKSIFQNLFLYCVIYFSKKNTFQFDKFTQHRVVHLIASIWTMSLFPLVMSIMLRNYEETVKQVMFIVLFSSLTSLTLTCFRNDITLFYLIKAFHISGEQQF